MTLSIENCNTVEFYYLHLLLDYKVCDKRIGELVDDLVYFNGKIGSNGFDITFKDVFFNEMITHLEHEIIKEKRLKDELWNKICACKGQNKDTW